MRWVTGGRLWRARGCPAGFAMIDVVVGMTVLAFVSISVMNVFLTVFTQARTSGVHAEAATWVQGEAEYLRGLDFDHTCLGAGARTITPTSPPCSAVEPPLPAGFVQASVQVEDDALGRPGLKRLTIEVSRTAGTVFFRVATYVTELE